MAARFLIAAALLLSASSSFAQQTRPMEIKAPQLGNQSAKVQVYLPPNFDAGKRYPVLYFNDGQDAQSIHLEKRLKDYYAQKCSTPRIVVAVPMFEDRMGTYGLADLADKRSEVAITKYGPVGSKALEYTELFTQTLIPYVDKAYPTQANAQGRAVLGWSLGAVAAFSAGWQRPDLIGKVGMFSPSLWLSTDSTTPVTAEDTRLVQRRVTGDARAVRPAIYLAVGTKEDKDDRDGDGVNDAMDDVFDMSKALSDANVKQHISLLGGGEHNQRAWSEMLPRFLNWLDDNECNLHSFDFR